MAIAQRKSVQTTHPSVGEGPRAKSLRPFERAGSSLRPDTLEALSAFVKALQQSGRRFVVLDDAAAALARTV